MQNGVCWIEVRSLGLPAKTYLVRVFVDADWQRAEVAAAYRTSFGMTTMRRDTSHNRADREGVIHALQQHLPELRARYQVRSLGVFGSYARGEARKNSDLDLLVEFDRVPTLLRFIELEQHLSDFLRVKVDLVMKDALKPAIGRRILEELVPV